nr:SMP-30/gluconolactonase/LRE family protein [Pararhizobium sp. IMCC3301]
MSDHIVIHDPRFRNLMVPDAPLERIHSGMLWAEGPVYFPHGDYFLWSDIPNNQVLQWIRGCGVRLYDSDANNSNGHTRDREGRLISCEHLTRRVTRTEHDGSLTVIADSHGGKRLNSPNDAVVKSDGSIWFTDPSYGIISDYEGKIAAQEQDGCHVFCVDPDSGETRIVADDFVKPNGLAFSPDESVLYIADSGRSHDAEAPHHIRAFACHGETLSGGDVLIDIEQGVPDGLRIDVGGNIWTSSAIGVECFDSGGAPLGAILVPETVANLSFGGRDGRQMVITATTSVYAISVATTGAGS